MSQTQVEVAETKLRCMLDFPQPGGGVLQVGQVRMVKIQSTEILQCLGLLLDFSDGQEGEWVPVPL